MAGLRFTRENAPPFSLGIIGLVHDHVREFLPELLKRRDIMLVGIVETNKELAAEIAKRFGLSEKLFFSSIEALRAKTGVQAVAAFTSTFDHRQVVELCAQLGIHVMMEKPMAVNTSDAQAMAAAARRGGIKVVVNYETSWYPSLHRAYELVHQQRAIGDLRKLVIHDGHSGPAPTCSRYFLNWLTDPVLNGGGALMDFGCYGADLATWLMKGERPTSVFAVTQQFQPEIYPKVDDEATIILSYPRTQAIIQASWNWPYSRKDIEIYGQSGALRLPDRTALFLRKGVALESKSLAPALPLPQADSLSHFAAVVREKIQPIGLGSLEINLVVNEILEAAKESARTGRRIDFAEDV